MKVLLTLERRWNTWTGEFRSLALQRLYIVILAEIWSIWASLRVNMNHFYIFCTFHLGLKCQTNHKGGNFCASFSVFVKVSVVYCGNLCFLLSFIFLSILWQGLPKHYWFWQRLIVSWYILFLTYLKKHAQFTPIDSLTRPRNQLLWRHQCIWFMESFVL